TLIAERPLYRWGPLAPKDKVSSLLDEAGYFYSNDRRAEFPVKARIDEVELEFRAQIGAVLATGLRPTHLDWHCLYDGGRDDILDLTLALALEFGLALRIHGRDSAEKARREGLPTTDHEVLDSYSLSTDGKA